VDLVEHRAPRRDVEIVQIGLPVEQRRLLMDAIVQRLDEQAELVGRRERPGHPDDARLRRPVIARRRANRLRRNDPRLHEPLVQPLPPVPVQRAPDELTMKFKEIGSEPRRRIRGIDGHPRMMPSPMLREQLEREIRNDRHGAASPLQLAYSHGLMHYTPAIRIRNFEPHRFSATFKNSRPDKKTRPTPGFAVQPNQYLTSSHTAIQTGTDNSAPIASPVSTFPSGSSRFTARPLLRRLPY